MLCSYSVIRKRKGLFQILKLLKRRTDLAYICIGDGEQKKKLIKYAKRNDINNRIFFSPFKKNPYHIIKYVDVFVFPSYSEGFGLALIEAGLIGTSAVCSIIPSTTRICNDSEVSFFTLDDIDSLSIAVDEAINLKIEKIEKFKKHIENDFTEYKMFQAYQKLYKKLLYEEHK